MEIFVLDVPSQLRPSAQPFDYPVHNKDYGVEQDFLKFVESKRDIITSDPAKADWHYLGVFWTRWHLSHDYGRNGLQDLQQFVGEALIDDRKTFTICQYDDGPLIDLGKSSVFLASRKSENGIDIPLLCTPHRKPLISPKRKYRASFVGRLETHPIRQEMAHALVGKEDVAIVDGMHDEDFFVRKVLESRITLAPRGYGGSSFRFFEAMQLGSVPMLVGDLDTRPFKKWIPWDALSLFASSADQVQEALSLHSPEVLREMGMQAAQVWKNSLAFGKWCRFVLAELAILGARRR